MQKKLMMKILVILCIGLLLMVPLVMISEKISERNSYLESAKSAVAQNWTGHQRLITPILVVPYVVQPTEVVESIPLQKIHTTARLKVQLFTASELNIDANLKTDIRYKGIYKVPVYNATIAINGKFDKTQIQAALAAIRKLPGFKHFKTPYLSSVVSDSRGISNIPVLQWAAQSVNFVPGSRLALSSDGLHATLSLLTLTSGPSKAIKFAYELAINGMEKLDFVAVAKQSEVNISSNWAHPAFVGDFLPHTRAVSNDGYKAQWRISSFASNVTQKLNLCALGKCDDLMHSSFGVKHIEPVSIYVQAERSVKYGVLFIGLSFIAFFIFEIVQKLAIHAIAYTLVGSAIAIFYLLLISLSEHIAFNKAYLIAACCSIGLQCYYLSHILRGYKDALLFSVLLSLLFAVLYVIISAEDYALLMGAVLTFIALALVMICTRNINWYGIVDTEKAQKLEK